MTVQALEQVIGALGGELFQQKMFDYLAALASGDHFSLLRFGQDQCVQLLGTASRPQWRFAGSAQQAYLQHYHQLDPNRSVFGAGSPPAAPVVQRLRREQVPDSDYRRYCYDAAGLIDRLSVLVADGPQWYSLNLYRSQGQGQFDQASADLLSHAAPVLAALVKKHDHLGRQSTPPRNPGDQLARFEARLAQLQPGLSQREIAVMGRMLCGVTAHGIALDLGIGLQSVLTYRRRAYAKLGISSQRQLFALTMLAHPAEPSA